MGGKEGRREGGRKGGREEGRQAGRSREKDLCCQENEHTFHLASVSPSLPPLPPIPPGCFYVTEADGTGLALHFFRKPVWDRVQVEREGGREGRMDGGCDRQQGKLSLEGFAALSHTSSPSMPSLPPFLPPSFPPSPPAEHAPGSSLPWPVRARGPLPSLCWTRTGGGREGGRGGKSTLALAAGRVRGAADAEEEGEGGNEGERQGRREGEKEVAGQGGDGEGDES